MIKRMSFFLILGVCLISMLLILGPSLSPLLGITKPKISMTWMEWGKKYWPTKPVRGGYLRAAATKYIGLMNPNHWPVNDWVSIGYFYEKLFYTDGQYRPTVPWLVESWEYLDPVTVLMKLKKGIKFHDGSDFNARSVKYQIDWVMNPKNGAWTRAWLEPIKSVEVVDTYTVKWHFKRPWGAFLAMLAYTPGYALSAEGLKKGARYMDTHPIGTGPYMLEEARPGNYLKVKRNPNWWFGKGIGHPDMPYFDGIKVYVIPDLSVQLANLRAGKIDIMTLDKSQYMLLKNDPNIKLYIYPGPHTMALRFNLAKGPCKDIRVRKAISHAIDRKALIVGTQFGLGRLASGPLPDDHWAHNPDLKPVSYDPQLSRKLLKEAGYEKGLKIRGYMSNYPYAMTAGEAIKAMLKAVGIDWKVEFLDTAAWTDRMKNLEYDVAQGGWTWIYDPDLMFTGLYHPMGGFNYGRSKNQQAIELIMKGRSEVDFQKRTQIYRQLEKVLYDDYEDAWLWYDMTVTAMRKNVLGWNHEMYLEGKEAYWWSHPLWFKDGKP